MFKFSVVLSLEELLSLSYLKDKMSQKQKQILKENYAEASVELQEKISRKFIRVNKIYEEYLAEGNPQKRTRLLFKILTLQIKKIRKEAAMEV